MLNITKSSLWDCELNKTRTKKVIEKPLNSQEKKQIIKSILEPVVENTTTDDLYVITAGASRAGTPKYICFYKDGKEWSISAVATISTKEKVEKIYNRVIKDIPKLLEQKGKRFEYQVEFKIEPVKKDTKGVIII